MNRWERRTPLAPVHVRKLVREGYTVIVQPSKMRIFTDDQYLKAGAVLKVRIFEFGNVLQNYQKIDCRMTSAPRH